VRKIARSLFEQAQDAMAAPPAEIAPAPTAQPPAPPPNGGFKSIYDISNQEALAKELADTTGENTKLLANKIVNSYNKNEFALKIGMAAEPNFDRFSVLLKNTFSLNKIFVDAPEIQTRLAGLISLAYYHAQNDPDKQFRVYLNKDTAKQVTEAIFTALTSTLKMTFLTYDTEFAELLKKAIFSVVLYIKPPTNIAQNTFSGSH